MSFLTQDFLSDTQYLAVDFNPKLQSGLLLGTLPLSQPYGIQLQIDCEQFPAAACDHISSGFLHMDNAQDQGG
jgi:hypothetical protein